MTMKEWLSLGNHGSNMNERRARSTPLRNRFHPFGILGIASVLMLTICAASVAAEALSSTLKIEPIGSNPRANKMTAEEFKTYTADWRTRYERFIAEYAPDYSDSEWMLGPPRDGCLATPLPLARGGKAIAEIVVDLDPKLHTLEASLGRSDCPPEAAVMRHVGHVVVKNAVNELKYWLDTLTGADFPVVQTPSPGERTRIFVGAHFARPHFAADLERLGEGEALDGFAVRSRGRDIFIFGATAKGTLNGVYAFIENNSDLIWAHSFSDLGTVYTVTPDMNAVWADSIEKPGTVQRGWLGHYGEQDGAPEPLWMWQMRNRSNFIVAPGPSPKKAEWGCWREGGGHMLGTFLPEPAKPYFPWIPAPGTGELKQPEKIEHYHHNICMTHPDLPEAYAKKCVEYFREQREKNPNTPLSALRLGVEDPDASRNYGLCRCERCLRPIKLSDGREIPVQNAVKEGLTFRTTQYHLLLEAIARAMKEEFPDARFSSYAYYFAAEPPPFQTAVQPWFCPYGGGGQLRHRCYRSPLFSEYNDKWWNYAYRWSRISDVVVLRDYNGLQAKGRPFAEIVGWDVRSLRDLKVNRFANEIGGSIHDPFSQMDVWVANRIYWNPDADVSKLNAYYLRRTFREGAPAMARFFEAIHRYWYAEHKNPEDFVQLGWIILQTGKQNELHQHLKTALKTARHPMARANIARLLTTFETWFHLNLEAATAAEMLVNAKLGRHVPFSSFIDGDNPVAVSYMTVRDEKPMDSEPMYHRGNVGGMTLRIRLKPVGKAVEDKFPLPEISVSQFSPGITDRTEGSAWTMPVQGKRQKDGGYLYTIPLKKISNFATGTMGNLTIRFSYNELEWRIPNGYQPEFAVYGLELADKNGKRYADPGIEERLGKKDRARWP